MLLAIILGLVACDTAHFQSEVEALEQTHLGKTFFDTVQIAVQSKEPLDRVFQILRDQANYYEKEFLSLDEKHKGYQCKCKKELSDFENMIALNRDRFNDVQGALDEKNPEKLRRVTLLQGKKKDLTTVNGRVEEITLQRNKQKCMFESRMDEHHIAMQAVVAVRKIFENAIGDDEDNKDSDIAFVELSEDETDKITALLGYANSKASEFKYLQGYTALFSVLEQMEVSSIGKHRDAIERVVQMCLDLEEYIEQTRTLLRSVDEIRERQFQRVYDSLSADQRTLRANVDELETDIQSLEAQIKVLDMDRDELLTKLETKQKQKADRLTECEQDDSTFQLKIQENQRERETIKRTLDLCMDNVKELKQYIKKRGDPYYKTKQ